MLDVFAFILLVMPLVVVHELGHWAAARALGVACPVFSIGIGTRPSLSVTALGTRWQLTPWIVGGYVLPDQAAFVAAHPWRRLVIIAAGPLANVLLAVAILAGVAMAYGHGPVQAIAAGASLTVDLVLSTAQAVGSLMIGDTADIGGPVMLASAGGDALERAAAGSGVPLAIVAAALSIGLGITNLLPIPILDGGRLLVTLGEWAAGRDCPPALERVLGRIGMALVGLLLAVVLAVDLARLLGGS